MVIDKALLLETSTVLVRFSRETEPVRHIHTYMRFTVRIGICSYGGLDPTQSALYKLGTRKPVVQFSPSLYSRELVALMLRAGKLGIPGQEEKE